MKESLEINKIDLINKPTALEFMPRLSDHLGVTIYVKRDDQGGRGEGGNKLRKYERILGDALANGCDTVIIAGHYQSNAARLLVASACRTGLKSIVICKNFIPRQNDAFDRNGNALLMHIMGADLRPIPQDKDYAEAMEDVAREVRKIGGSPYIIPFGGSNLAGTLGYVDCSVEISKQMLELTGKEADHIVATAGTGATMAGLLAGLTLQQSTSRLWGFSILHPKKESESITDNLAMQALHHLGSNAQVKATVDDGYLGEGYAIPTRQCLEASRLVARLEGLFLCPVYTAKTMAGLIDYVKTGRIGSGDSIVFLHSGGAPLLYAYYDSYYK